jgi:hypothetical protein
VIGLLAVVMAACLGAVVSKRRTPQPAAAANVGSASPQVRQPAAAGTFYPAESAVLRKSVEQFLNQAAPAKERGELVALIVPHAGYEYSGKVAGCAYRQIVGRKYDDVVIVGPSHRVPFQGVALSGARAWSTPLGEVLVDHEAESAIAAADSRARVFPDAHAVEHSIEVQLPFLQVALKVFHIAPVSMVDFGDRNCESLAKALVAVARRKRVLLIASSDMSHYPSYEDAVRVDKHMLKAIESLDARAVERTAALEMGGGTPNLQTALCGEGPVKTILTAARSLGANRAHVLCYANSGDVPGGTRSQVVGYCAVAIYRVKGLRAPAALKSRHPEPLNLPQQRSLLRLARTAIDDYLGSRETAECPSGPREGLQGPSSRGADEGEALLQPAGAFVTLKERGELRGCIGTTEGRGPLCAAVRDMAIAAAVRDPRFRPVTREELPRVTIEISVLSPLRRVSGPAGVDIKKHGVVVEYNGRSGVFLPQVARETGWSRDVLLSELCEQKAGLPRDAWQHGAALYVFTVQEFHE